MKLPDDMDEVCKAATATWGSGAQENIAIGEIGEFLTLIGRRQQGRATESMWIDEIADGLIMYTQMAHLHGKEAVEKRIAEKIVMIKARIASTNARNHTS
jgi:hypothetical protein